MDIPRFITTTDIPAQFLKATYFVGATPFKALRTDPRVSYSLYIPPEHYNPDPSLLLSSNPKELAATYRLPRLPLVVNIHGTDRRAETCRDALQDFADTSRMAVLVPLFPAGIDSFNDLDNYKLLRYKDFCADIVLLDILDEVKLRWPGIDTEKVFMVGYSGGAQFVHRFMYLYPERLHAVSIGSPGRVTLLDESSDWPLGIRNVTEMFDGAAINMNTIREVKIQLVDGPVAEELHGGHESWTWARQKRTVFRTLNGENNGTIEKNGKRYLGNSAGDRVAVVKGIKMAWELRGIHAQLDTVDSTESEPARAITSIIVEFLRPLVEELVEKQRARNLKWIHVAM